MGVQKIPQVGCLRNIILVGFQKTLEGNERVSYVTFIMSQHLIDLVFLKKLQEEIRMNVFEDQNLRVLLGDVFWNIFEMENIVETF